MILPIEGDVVYAVAHQHIGGKGSALYGEDGRIICSSAPIYGHGMSAGDEAGYIVGRSTCYPEPGTMRIAKGEALTVESNYSNEKRHTGVMGHFYILIANTSFNFNEPVQVRSLPFLRYTFSKKLITFNGLIYLKTIDMEIGMYTLHNK
ncbi:putative stress up-regulated Nod 19 [Helianthus annuus]|nr:putative stress up-regulated Nod 19 [Helianthus annuus]